MKESGRTLEERIDEMKTVYRNVNTNLSN